MTTNPHTDAEIVRFPIAHSVRYVSRGLPEVPNQYGRGVLAPSEITLTYRAAEDSQLGRVHAYVAGRLWVDGVEVPLLNDGLFGQHYDAGFDGWPVWLAEEAQLHDPDGLVAKVDEATTILRRIRSTLRALKDRGATGFAYHQAITDDLAGPRPDRDEPDHTDLTEPDIDRMMAAGTPAQIVTAPPATFAAVSVPAPAPTDQAERRERYAAAIRAAGDTAYGNSPFYEAITGAVIAVADAEQAELRRERDLAIAHDRQPYPTAWAYEQACAALRRKTEAIERVRSVLESEAVVGRSALDYRGLITTALMGDDAAAASGSGRVADETQAEPPRHRWAVETRDGLADEWAPGTRFLNRHHAVERYEALSKNHPTWRDGTPVERRIVRETVTYTVEQPAVVSQPEAHRCGNCEGIDPGSCLRNPARAVVSQPDGEASRCGPAPDQCNAETGEPCAKHEREQSHTEGDHSLCRSVDCEVLRQS